jgi:hypothetical protein
MAGIPSNMKLYKLSAFCVPPWQFPPAVSIFIVQAGASNMREEVWNYGGDHH